MEKLRTQWVSLKNIINSLLNEDFQMNPIEKKKIQEKFEVDRNPASLKNLSVGLPDQHIDKAVALFQRLSSHFEAGLFFENSDGKYRLHASFESGIVTPVHIDPRPLFDLPQLQMMEVLQTSAINILDRIPKGLVFKRKDARAFLLKLSSDFSIVLISELPDPWMKEHLETTIQSLALAMGESLS